MHSSSASLSGDRDNGGMGSIWFGRSIIFGDANSIGEVYVAAFFRASTISPAKLGAGSRYYARSFFITSFPQEKK